MVWILLARQSGLLAISVDEGVVLPTPLFLY